MGRKIAEERIRRLFRLADKRMGKDREGLSSRYMELARDISMSYNVPIPSDLKKRMCESCYSFLTPGKNCIVRISSKQNVITYKCQICSEQNIYGF